MAAVAAENPESDFANDASIAAEGRATEATISDRDSLSATDCTVELAVN